MERVISDQTCCGMRNYTSFNSIIYIKEVFTKHTHKTMVAQINKLVERGFGGYCTLTRNQMDLGWDKALEECDWTDVGSFKNPNSGNTVHIWIYLPRKKAKKINTET